MAWSVSADVERFDEALEWFLQRTILTDEERRAIPAGARTNAFWVAGSLQADQVQRVFDSLEKAIEQGEPFEEWRKRVRKELASDAHAETVFRNATQGAYNAGRWAQMTEPSVSKFRPFWMYDAIRDSRTTELCQGLNGTILPHDHPWWDTHIPPLHHRCRSSIRNLRRSEAERRGVTPQPPDAPPQEGFGASPRLRTGWRPDLTKYDPAIAAELPRKEPPPPPPPPPRKELDSLPEGKLPRKEPPSPRFLAEAKRRAEGFDPGLRNAVREYTDGGGAYSMIRDAGRLSEAEWVDRYPAAADEYRRLRRVAEELTDGILRHGGLDTTPRVLYRGMRLPRSVVEDFVNADAVVADTVSSTSHNASIGLNFTGGNPDFPGDTPILLRLRLRHAVNTLSVESISEVAGEGEILIAAGKRFRVTGAERVDYLDETLIVVDAEEAGPRDVLDPSRTVRLEVLPQR